MSPLQRTRKQVRRRLWRDEQVRARRRLLDFGYRLDKGVAAKIRLLSGALYVKLPGVHDAIPTWVSLQGPPKQLPGAWREAVTAMVTASRRDPNRDPHRVLSFPFITAK